MARTLSRVALSVLLFSSAAAVTLVAANAPAQTGVHVSSAAKQVENPFAAKRQTAARTEPATRTKVPPAENAGPKTYQNPFARPSALPRFVTPRFQPGPLSRWHRANEPSAQALMSDASVDTNNLELSGPLAAEQRRATLFSLPDHEDDGTTLDTSLAPAPPDPSHFGSCDLAQPTWLVPNETSPATAKGKTGNSWEQAQAVARPPTDPFEETESEEIVVSDGNPIVAQPEPTKPHQAKLARSVAENSVARPLPRPTPCDADGWYTQAERAAADAANTNDLAAVVQRCQRGLKCRPNAELRSSLRSLAAWACNRSGEIESDQRRDDKALNAFELAIQWDPNCWLALHNRAVSRAQQGDLDGALADFNRTLTLNPGLAVAYRNRGELLAATGRTEEAVADYTTALAQLPDDADLLSMRGEALHRLGQYEAAIADLTHSIETAPQNAIVYAQRGNVRAELGDYQRAIADFHQALSIDAQSAEAYRSLAWLLATCPDPHCRNPRQALVLAERAAQLAAPGDPFVLDALAAAHANAGHFDRAIRFQQEAIVNVPEDFAGPFRERLALYQQQRPFHNGASDLVDENVRAASLEAAPHSPR